MHKSRQISCFLNLIACTKLTLFDCHDLCNFETLVQPNFWLTLHLVRVVSFAPCSAALHGLTADGKLHLGLPPSLEFKIFGGPG